jgi:hypothetical protein
MPLASASYAITKLNDGLTTFYQYAKHTSNTTPPTTGWSDLVPSSEAGKFIWRREARALSLGLIGSGDWGGVICLTGATGDPGATGKGIVSITQEYYQSDSMLVLEGGSWGESVPAWSNGKYTWTRTRTDFSDSTSATTDPVCVTGPPGVNGNPGQLGIYAEGSTLIVKGFAEDGTLTASQGYIYVGDSRITVPAYSQQLTGEGQGYVVWDGTSVQFAKMQLQSSSIKWLLYNGSTEIYPSIIIGKFEKVGSDIFSEIIFEPLSVDQYNKSHFMEILSEHDWTELEAWADALGIQQVFRSIAAWQIFTDELIANTGFIDKLGTKELVLKDNGYIQSDAFSWEAGNRNGFKLDSNGNLKAVSAELTQATIDASDNSGTLLKTQYGADGGTAQASSPSRWMGSDAYALEAHATTKTVTYDGASCNARWLNSLLLSILGLSYVYAQTWTCTYTGRYKFTLGGGKGYYGWYSVTRGGVEIYSYAWGGSTYDVTHELLVGDIVEIGHDHQEYSWASCAFVGVGSNDNPGIVIYTGTLSYGPTIIEVIYADQLLAISKRFIVDTWDSNDHLSMAPVTGWDSALLQLNIAMPCDPAHKITYDGNTYSPYSLLKTSTSLALSTMEGPTFTMSRTVETTNLATKGWYPIAGTLYFLSEERGLLTDNIIPAKSSLSVGTPTLPFNMGNFNIGNFNIGNFNEVNTTSLVQDGEEAYACRAWVNFNGKTNVSGNCTINGSQGISSVADNGSSGQYTVNFSFTMLDNTYGVTAMAIDSTTAHAPVVSGYATPISSAMTTTSCKFRVYSVNARTTIDAEAVMLAFFR